MSYKIPSKEYIDTRINSFNNGPKDVFDTVAELVSTNPDHGYIYLVLENGYWYFWDGEEWLQGGHYGTTPEIIQLKTDAQTAKNDAVIAKGQAEGARDIAVTAKDNAVIAQGLAEDAKDEAQAIAGGVAGTYDTLVDLQTANPSHGSVYLVVADANWYYWDTNVSDWLAGGVYSNEPAIASLNARLDTNRLYSDSQYLELKAKCDSLQVKCNTLQAEVYTDNPILQYGATEIIGKGYEADATPIDVSANVVDGKLSMEQKGLTITNWVENGDSLQGLSGWGALGGTLSVSTGSFLFTENTLTEEHYARQNLSKPLTINHKYAFFCEYKEKVDGVVHSIVLYNRLISGNYQQVAGTSVYGTSGVSLGTITITEQNSTPHNFIRIYAKSGIYTGTGVTFKFGKVRIIDLTSLGLDHITDTDILAKLLPYVDGTQNVGKMGVRVVDDNLYDLRISPAFIASDKAVLVTEEGRLCWKITNSTINGVIPIPFISGQRYTMSMTGKQTGGNGRLEYIYTDGTSSYTTNFGGAFGGITNISTSGKTVASIRFNWGDAGTTFIDVDTFMLNLGSSALPYTPYQEQLTFLPSIGNRVPNGTADSIKTVADGWEHTKRVSDEVDLGTLTWYNSGNNRFYSNEIPDAKILGSIYNTQYPVASSWVDYLATYPSIFLSDAKKIWIADVAYSDAGVLKSALNGVILHYELATPITTHYDLPLPTSGKTIHRFAGEEKISLYGTGVTFTENVLSVLSAVKFVAGVMTDITSLATITTNTVTFSGVNATDVVYVKVEHDVDRPLGILEHTPAVSNTASRLAAIEAWIAAQGA